MKVDQPMSEATTITIRQLTADDAEAYRVVRLRALRDHPEAFTIAYDDEVGESAEYFVERVVQVPTFGAFDGDTLVGIIGVTLNHWQKIRHRAVIIRVYVAPEVRGQGVAHKLLDTAMAFVRSLPQIEIVELEVTVGNEGARRMYVEAGFTTYGVNRRAFKIEGKYYDVEMMAMDLER
ncbi:MAG: GNAT family N-acetyltransferase [Anaerolineae bacterium]|nr:GNAT family N-acetyltransferase [Anaerolineae bacterium]